MARANNDVRELNNMMMPGVALLFDSVMALFIPIIAIAQMDWQLLLGMTNHTMLAEEGGPLLMESAEGIYVTDVEGNRYIDGISGMYFRNAGHGREEIAKAIYDQPTSVSMNVYSGATPKTIQLAAILA